MSVKIRMKRLGAKKKPFYRIVVADSRRARNGRFIEELGFYNPVSEPRMFRVDADKAKEWIGNGAQPSETVAKLFKEYGVFDTEGVVAIGIEEQKKEKKVVESSSVDTEEEVDENLDSENDNVEEVEENQESLSDDQEEEEKTEEREVNQAEETPVGEEQEEAPVEDEAEENTDGLASEESDEAEEETEA